MWGALKGGSIIAVSDEAPDYNERMTWIRITDTGKVEVYEPSEGAWTLVASTPDFALSTHSHSSLGDVDLTGAVSVNGDKGIDGEFDSKKHTLRKLKVQSGIITELEVEEA
jgi:hypothetical protein